MGQKLVAAKPISNHELVSLAALLRPQLIFSFEAVAGAVRYNEDQVGALLGYGRADFDSNNFSIESLVHPDDYASFRPQNTAVTIRLRHKDGVFLPFCCTAVPHGGVQFIIAIPADGAPSSVHEHELTDTVTELQRSNRELEEFAYIASHDLQEPLRKISTFAGRLAEKFPDQRSYDDAQQYINRICYSAENMRQLINNLLDFSRITKVDEPFVCVNMNVVLREVRADLELSIEESGMAIMADKLPDIKGRFSQMKQLVHNIVTNAIKFHKPGQMPQLQVTCKEVLHRGKPFHQLQFCDNGIGFEDQYANRIFQIFQRLHGKSEYPGSGIGLAICKKIVEHHGGEIFASNIQEQGACFTILLPILNP